MLRGMSTEDSPQYEYIPADVYERELEGVNETRPEGGVVAGQVKRELNRRSVARNFLEAFELIGGVPALAVWASEEGNRGDFYKMYARMAPSAQHDTGGGDATRVIHVIPPSPLDE